jgi:hypothetical protein
VTLGARCRCLEAKKFALEDRMKVCKTVTVISLWSVGNAGKGNKEF